MSILGSHFFAMLSRMKYIERWSLMWNSNRENISEHSQETAMLAHILAVISNVRLQNHLNAERAALLGLYHDVPEIITGDMPTPIKYYNEEIHSAFKKVEQSACEKLLEMLPEDIKEVYKPLFFEQEPDSYLTKLVKAADKLSAFIKCIEEEKAGNNEFTHAKKTIIKSIETMKLKEVEIFCEEFLPSYYKTLDELNKDIITE